MCVRVCACVFVCPVSAGSSAKRGTESNKGGRGKLAAPWQGPDMDTIHASMNQAEGLKKQNPRR